MKQRPWGKDHRRLQLRCHGTQDALKRAMTRAQKGQIEPRKSTRAPASVSGGAGEHRVCKRNNGQRQQSQPTCPQLESLSGPKGRHHASQGVMKLACTYPMGQHLVLVPEESSDRVAWRTWGREGPNAGPWTPRVSEVSIQHPCQGQMTTAKE